jgi:hypothetical protein
MQYRFVSQGFHSFLCKTSRIVSLPTSSTLSTSTTFFLSHRLLHRAYPVGASVQASVISCASCLPVTFLFSGLSGCFRRFSASSSPCVRKRRRTRQMVAVLTPNASCIRSFDHCGPCFPQSDFNNMCACRIVCADVCPLEMMSSTRERCSSVSSMLFFIGGMLPFLRFECAERIPHLSLFFK